MWARYLEALLGLWLAAAPAVLGGADAVDRAVAIAAAASLVGLALLSHWPRTRYAHLGSAAVGAAIAAFGWLRHSEGAQLHESHVIVGLTVLMFALVPSHASRPPAPWAEAMTPR